MLITDAVSVRFLSEKEVLAGVGNQLQYFYSENNVTKKKICPKKTKYKITQIEFCVSGDTDEIKLVAVAGSDLIFTSLKNNTFTKPFLIKINDWINFVHFGNDPSDRIFCVTAHNRASEISIDFLLEKATVINRTRCPEVSTAYSSSIYGKTWESLLLFAGTAFGELIIWSPEQVSETGKILLRVPNSHNGVIFDIQLSIEASLLTTCSDDRSVQLWKFNLNEDKPSLEKIKRCFAHVSRVFRSKIIKNNDKFYILSIGEDSHVCLWDHLGSLVYKKFLEECGTIWGLDYNTVTKTVVVVTNNGRIIKIPLEHQLEGNSVVIEEISGSTVAKLRYMTVVNGGFLICLTESNSIEVFDIKDVTKIKLDFQLDRDMKICLMETYKNYIFFVTTESQIILYSYLHEKNAFIFQSYKKIEWDDVDNDKQRSLIRSLIAINDDPSLLICSNNGTIKVLTSLLLEKTIEFRIPKCSEPWITSVLQINNGFLIGDRCGHLHLFKNVSKDPVHTLRRLHGTMGITQIIKVDSNTFKTTGHDGSIKTITLENDVLCHIFTQKMASINFIERCHGQFTFGFSSSYFIGHHDQDGILIEQNCGGGNRQYDLFLDDLEDAGTVTLAVIQQRKVKQVTFKIKLSKESNLNFLDIKWHHLCCNYLTLEHTKKFPLLISGGEETLMKFYSIRDLENPHIELLTTSTQHNSAIKSIISTLIDPKSDDLIIISVGSRAKICVTRLRMSQCGNISIEEETQFMLYEDKLTQDKDQVISFDPESSFTSATLVKSDNGRDILICGCSDGHLRFFNISLQAKPVKISLDKEIFYGKSVLHVNMITWNRFKVLVSMGTDGIINFYDFGTLNDTPIHQIKHHDSGIHAYDVCQEGSEVLIATGGDDQAIVVSKINLLRQGEKSSLVIETQKTFKIPDLHTAQVTGVRFLSENVLMSLGVDQMIYKITLKENLEEYDVEKALWTSVEDGKGLLYFKDKIIIYGNGIEIL